MNLKAQEQEERMRAKQLNKKMNLMKLTFKKKM